MNEQKLQPPPDDLDFSVQVERPVREAWRMFIRNRAAVVGLIILGTIIAMSLVGPTIYPSDPFDIVWTPQSPFTAKRSRPIPTRPARMAALVMSPRCLATTPPRFRHINARLHWMRRGLTHTSSWRMRTVRPDSSIRRLATINPH